MKKVKNLLIVKREEALTSPTEGSSKVTHAINEIFSAILSLPHNQLLDPDHFQ